jgi:hypothetical protein
LTFSRLPSAFRQPASEGSMRWLIVVAATVLGLSAMVASACTRVLTTDPAAGEAMPEVAARSDAVIVGLVISVSPPTPTSAESSEALASVEVLEVRKGSLRRGAVLDLRVWQTGMARCDWNIPQVDSTNVIYLRRSPGRSYEVVDTLWWRPPEAILVVHCGPFRERRSPATCSAGHVRGDPSLGRGVYEFVRPPNVALSRP